MHRQQLVSLTLYLGDVNHLAEMLRVLVVGVSTMDFTVNVLSQPLLVIFVSILKQSSRQRLAIIILIIPSRPEKDEDEDERCDGAAIE